MNKNFTPTNFKISQFHANEKLLRKLGPAELIYDYELTNKSHMLVSAMKFVTRFDIFSDTRLIETSLHAWKCLHPFLRTKIVNQSKDTRGEYFSGDRWFLVNTEKSTNLDNVGFYKTEYDKDSVEDNHLDYFSKLLYEREFNNEPFDQSEESLWRLVFIELKSDYKSKDFWYFIIFNVHHGITDARNTFCILSQLLKIFEEILYERMSLNAIMPANSVPPSIETLLLKEDLNILSKISQSPEIVMQQKIPNSFHAPSLSENETLEIDTDFLKLSIKFTCLKPVLGKAGNWCGHINGYDLVLQNKFINVTKFKEIQIDKVTFNKICVISKSKEIKLTGCLNLIYLLATHKTYMIYSDDKSLNFHIHYHLMVNLRSYFNLDPQQMGFFSSVLSGEFKFDDSDTNENAKYLAFIEKFWDYAKLESDNIHRRLQLNEHVEAAKIDGYLLMKQLKETNGKVTFPNGGGVSWNNIFF
jgi:hypothetical protein